jgi:hypothetical protein
MSCARTRSGSPLLVGDVELPLAWIPAFAGMTGEVRAMEGAPMVGAMGRRLVRVRRAPRQGSHGFRTIGAFSSSRAYRGEVLLLLRYVLPETLGLGRRSRPLQPERF